MKISKTVETPDGGVTFEGVLNADELDLILSVGLNYLYQQGAIPFRVIPEGRTFEMAKGSDTEQ